jgi:hypothetical protein
MNVDGSRALPVAKRFIAAGNSDRASRSSFVTYYLVGGSRQSVNLERVDK